MAWNARLQLDYRSEPPPNAGEAAATRLRFHHDGPLRVLKSLYPEGPGICHNVLVHPPGGLVQGDTLEVAVQVQSGAHGLVSTPGATRFYRSSGEAATQQVTLTLAEGARLEWLPLETIAYPGCVARNHLTLDLAPGSELLAWEVCALGLPSTGQAFDHGHLHQRILWPGRWREEAHVHGHDRRLLDSPLGLAGHRCLATLFLACGTAPTPQRREALLDALRDTLGRHGLSATAAATSPHPQVLVVRVLAALAEPAMALLQQLWAVLRHQAWGLGTRPPRIWSV